MAANSKIEWTDATWNPTAGCSVVSPGCTNCYAMRAAWRFQAQPKYAGTVEKVNGRPVWTGKVNLDEKALAAPLTWRRPRRVFVDSMSDLFHEAVPDAWIDRVFAVMALTPQHTYQVLTKRPARMRAFCDRPGIGAAIWDLADARACEVGLSESHPSDRYLRVGRKAARWPLPNVWLGVSVEDQKRADERIPALLDTPAAVRFLSCEPLLGPVDLSAFLPGHDALLDAHVETGLHWVICGGESGPRARPMEPAWARSLRGQCQAAGVAFFMKQMARKAPIPADLMVRAFPSVIDPPPASQKK